MTHLVTGGSGFLGSALVKELVAAGHHVRVLDDQSRGRSARLDDVADDIELFAADVRDAEAVLAATRGCSTVWHLAYINGTRFFYERPDAVLDVGIKGAFNTLEAALEAGVERYVLASTSETYNNPTHVPTDETERLMIPDVTNPRFSYGGGKIASELLTLHFGGKRGLETVIFRPHNIYGPDMGHEHVIPELVARIGEASDGFTRTSIELTIQGDGSDTRAFCFVTDGARGARIAGERGGAGEIYHLGTEEEVTILQLVEMIAATLDIAITVVPGPRREGGTPRRCPDISKLRGLGYEPEIDLMAGLERTIPWYVDHVRRVRA
jgi:nucleoside-diphosphate-sugar epimerase